MKHLIIKSVILLVPALVIMVTSGCNSTGTGKKLQSAGIISIHIDPVDAIKDQINLSHIADKIEYIPLQTTDSSVIGSSPDFKVTGDMIFIREQNCILEFTKEGQFIRRLFTVGNAPEESIARSFAVDEEGRKVYAYDIHTREGNIYDFEGKFISDFNKQLYDPDSWISDIGLFRSSIFVSIPVRPGTEYLFSCYDLRNDSIIVLRDNPYVFTAAQANMIPQIVPSNNGFQITDTHIFFKDMYSDTIFKTDKDFETEPYCVVDLGKEKLRWEDFRDNGMFDITAGPPRGYWVESFVDTKAYLILYIQSFTEPELLCIYDKKSGGQIVASNKEYKTSSQQVLMANDLDHLKSFPPMSGIGRFYYYNGCLYSIIEAKDFTEVYMGAPAEAKKSTDYLTRMEQAFSRIDELDNPLIMKVHLK
jgi:hypothetical protein